MIVPTDPSAWEGVAMYSRLLCEYFTEMKEILTIAFAVNICGRGCYDNVDDVIERRC